MFKNIKVPVLYLQRLMCKPTDPILRMFVAGRRIMKGIWKKFNSKKKIIGSWTQHSILVRPNENHFRFVSGNNSKWRRELSNSDLLVCYLFIGLPGNSMLTGRMYLESFFEIRTASHNSLYFLQLFLMWAYFSNLDCAVFNQKQ